MSQLTAKICFVFRNLLNEAELQSIWKALLSNESVVKRAWEVSIMSIAGVFSLISRNAEG